MKQYEYVIKAMEENGGYATLGQLYQKVDVSSWRTGTPFASIRRIVQDDRFFFLIKPGLWALKSKKKNVLQKFSIDDKNPSKTKEEFNHTYYQGLLAEIGNLKGFETFLPNQDKNKLYLEHPLKDYSSLKEFYQFTNEDILSNVSTIDVCWFNERKFPNSVFEVEYTTDINNSLRKFLYLQDFNTEFQIVASEV